MTFERIYTHVIEKAGQLAPRNTHAIREWLAAGYDVEQDIIPAIDACLKRGGRTIFSWGFFTHSIQMQHEKRLKSIKQDDRPQHVKDEARAKNIRWMRDMGIAGIQDLDWLTAYEKEKSPTISD